MDFFRSFALWPEPADEPGFASLLALAKQLLVAHFGDALAVLNTSVLRVALFALPAVALEALLESDEFGTDTESSVLLMLAMWVDRSYRNWPLSWITRLCMHVRLVQLSRPYLTSVLPALAAEHDAGPASAPDAPGPPRAWFPVSIAEASFIASLAGMADGPRSRLLRCAKDEYDVTSAWYLSRPRRQCLTSSGRVYDWYVRQASLQRGLKAAAEAEPAGLDNGESHVAASINGASEVLAGGFGWTPMLSIPGGGGASRCPALLLACNTPAAFRDGAELARRRTFFAPAGITADLIINHELNGRLAKTHLLFDAEAGPIGTNCAIGKSLPGFRQQPAAFGGGRPIDEWADYLRDGKITGQLRLLPPEGRGGVSVHRLAAAAAAAANGAGGNGGGGGGGGGDRIGLIGAGAGAAAGGDNGGQGDGGGAENPGGGAVGDAA